MSAQTTNPANLSVELVRKFVATQLEFAKLPRPRQGSAGVSSFQDSDSVTAYEEDPAVRRILSMVGWTATDFVRIRSAIVDTLFALDLVEAGLTTALPDNVSRANADLLRNLPQDVAPTFALWKQHALDPALKELREIKRQSK